MESGMESKEIIKNRQDIWWKLYLFKVPKLSLEEIKVMLFLDILSGPTHCIRLLTTKHFRACGVGSSGIQEKVRQELEKKRILLTMHERSHDYILSKICRTCPYLKDEKACRQRKPTLWINKNVRDWVPFKKVKLPKTLINDLFDKNGLSEKVDEKKPLNQLIQAKIEEEQDTEKPEFHETDVFKDFMEKKGLTF